MQLSIDKKISKNNQCRFCNNIYSYKTALTRHIKTCKAKQEYREKLEAQLEAKLEESTKQPQHINHNTTNNIGTVNGYIWYEITAEGKKRDWLNPRGDYELV